MNRLEDSVFLTNVRARGDTQTANKACRQITCNITIQVREDDNIELRGISYHVHAEGIDNAVVEVDATLIFLGKLARNAKEQTIGVLHDVCFVSSGNLLATVLQRILEGISNNILRGSNRNRLDGDTGIRTNGARALFLAKVDQLPSAFGAFLELDASIQILGVLANNHEVNVVVTTASTGKRNNRAQANIEPERLAKRDVHAAKAGANGSRDRTLDSDFVALDSLNRGLRKRRAFSFKAMSTSLGDFPIDFRPTGLNNALHSGRSFNANSITGNQGHRMTSHSSSSQTRRKRDSNEYASRIRIEKNVECYIVVDGANRLGQVLDDGRRLSSQRPTPVLRIEQHPLSKLGFHRLRKMPR